MLSDHIVISMTFLAEIGICFLLLLDKCRKILVRMTAECYVRMMTMHKH